MTDQDLRAFCLSQAIRILLHQKILDDDADVLEREDVIALAEKFYTFMAKAKDAF